MAAPVLLHSGEKEQILGNLACGGGWHRPLLMQLDVARLRCRASQAGYGKMRAIGLKKFISM
jgi:hypothetical protein